MAEVFELFPTPVMRIPGFLSTEVAQALAARLKHMPQQANAHSTELSHSHILGPGDDDDLDAVVQRIGPHLQAFGQRLFGESLPWMVKEIWINVLRTGGRQALHNHANCFASGVLYLTASDASACTVFSRGMGGTEFVFRNTHAGSNSGCFSADQWVAPVPAAGDLLLFPSYLLHEVPVNQGPERITLAFNAITRRLDAWGYAMSFAP